MNRLIALLLMAFSLFGCGIGKGGRTQPAPEGPLNSYEFQRSNGRMMYPLKYIRVYRTPESGVEMEWSDRTDEITVLQLAPDALEHIDALFKEYELKKLKTMYLPFGDVRDGIMWHVYFGYEVHSMSTTADNAWPPKRQQEGIEAINAYLDSLVENASEEDILEIRSHQNRK